MSSDFVSPIYQKSGYFAIDADEILFFDRAARALVTPTWTEQPQVRESVPSGILLQNRSIGPVYMWYGAVPVELRTPAEFKKYAFLLPAGATFEPFRTQAGLLYLMSDNAGTNLHVMSH